MKLEDWAANKYRLDGVGEKGLHVIGTCGECKYWEKQGNEGWGNCNSLRSSIVDAQLGTVGYTFGCIHFEPKEGS